VVAHPLHPSTLRVIKKELMFMRKLMISMAIGAILLTAVALYFTTFHPYQIQVSEHFIQSPQVPATFEGARLIQLSDLLIENERDVRVLGQVVQQVNALSPDMVALTGNVFGAGAISPAVLEETSRLLGTLEADIGKVAVLGGIDLQRAEEVTEILEGVDFHVLRNESREFFNGTLAGISFLGMDPASHENNFATIIPRLQQEGMFQIWLTHEGQHAASVVDYGIALKLSGHCLGSTTPAPQCSQFFSGAYRFSDQVVNISTGVGNANTFFGFLKRPSIDSFLLIRQ